MDTKPYSVITSQKAKDYLSTARQEMGRMKDLMANQNSYVAQMKLREQDKQDQFRQKSLDNEQQMNMELLKQSM